jgi:invasion protein IalB
MRRQIVASLWTCLILVSGSIGSLGVVPTTFAQSEEEQMQPEDFGSWTVICTRNTVYRYVFCNAFHAQPLSESAGDFARFGVNRTFGSERIAFNVLNGFAPNSNVTISVDKENWVFSSSGDVALLASPSQSKKIIDLMETGKTVHLVFTPAGGKQRTLDISLDRFSEALHRVREQAR